jgi:hypothetical protein
LKIAESPERLSLSGGWVAGGIPQNAFHPLLLQEKGVRGMRYQYFHPSWCWRQASIGDSPILGDFKGLNNTFTEA